MKLDNMTVVEQVKVIMALTKMTEGQVAAKIGVSNSHLSNMLAGRKRFQLEHIEALTNELGYDIVFVKRESKSEEE